jgi:orotate phosphoribosyltransferase
MTKEKAIQIFKETGVMLEGHFLLTSGRHSERYMQCAKLFQYPEISEEFSRELAGKFQGVSIVAGPAIGGIILAYEVSRQLKVPNIFAERENGAMTLRRGFSVPEGAKVLVVEDVVTTGGSVKEVIDLIRSLGGDVVGAGSIVDRSDGKVDFGVPFHAVVSMEVISYEPDECPLCRQGIPAVKPGSRNLK